ncbi:polysaccharide deacetylase [Flavobacterium sp. N1719]|uniref:polysaccharide deacetylase n=1 Tax=Flavobacterium sp. N1719 TaxID=2885633 RepID=UPI002223A7C1|nr:polysaccharide deacetylase [Flavobacterium sp. N1719]
MKLTFCLRLLLFTSLFCAAQNNSISNYTVQLGTFIQENNTWILLREFNQLGEKWGLAVSTTSLQTKVIPLKSLQIQPIVSLTSNSSPYKKALEEANTNAIPLQDAGISHRFPNEKGITLTIDLCPSHKPLDRDLFLELIKTFPTNEQPIPVGLSITGKFLMTHEQDIEWLTNLEKKNKIKITWINHTFNHHYDPNLPLNQNFILEKGTSITDEVLKNEVALLEHHLIPSIYFRFPGLISSANAVTQITAMGLIPIGCDAWLAKGQEVYQGSIVLIHGNGNEPIGVKDFLKLLHKEYAAVQQKQWLLYDLGTDMEKEFKH